MVGVAYQVASTEKEKLDILLHSQLPTFRIVVDSVEIVTYFFALIVTNKNVK